jgi:2-polyprenyl-3-methyl-5-hydroxy-6-metoxy-1,4-benzoquinol methylase
MKYQVEHRACEVCGSDNNKLLWEKKPWSKAILFKQDQQIFHDKDYICLECGLVYKNPMLTEQSLKEFYNGPYAKLYKASLQKGIPKALIIEGVMRSIFTLMFLKSAGISLKGKKAFEVGVGMGTLFKGIKSLGAEMSGIDTDARNCEIAEKIFAIKYDRIDFMDFKTTERYDVIFICSTLEHFYSPKETLRRIRTMLKDDGILIVEIPSYEYPYMHCIVDAFFSSAHNYTFSFDSFYSLACQCGYDLKEFGYLGHNHSMLFALKKSDAYAYKVPVIAYDKILARLDEQDRARGLISEIGKELFVDTNVSKIIGRVLSELPNVSNQAFLSFVPPLLEAGRNQQIISLMEQYKPGQTENINFCEGTALHYKGLAYRQMGDFLEAKKNLLAAKEKFPRFEDYNFIEDLKLDGIISDEGFAGYIWWNNLKILEEIG